MTARSPTPGRIGMASPLADAPAELRFFLRRLALLGGLILVLLAAGTIGFALTAGTSIGFSFIWALDTIATIGSIPQPQDTGARIVEVALIVFGVGTLFYGLVTATEFLVAGRLSGLLVERRTQRMIDSLTEHHVICGFGRVGRQVARDMRAARQPYVVIDDNPDNREIAGELDAPFLEGRPSEDEILRRAGIERARAVLACMDSDAENIFVTLTARELRPDITIVARASVEDSEKKLKRAGADRVISPYKASGSEMARLALHPQVADVVDVGPGYRMEEIEVPSGRDGAGHRIDDVRGSSIIVALHRPGGSMQPMPPGETVLEAGDLLVAMGTAQAMDRLEALFD
ncbi:MAG TPA: TrkA family potassium uptake protein [Solirubrobacterales bacterium]|nr:TrkA family potassium uptake protein [Solirubrobacterales bacterium]